MPVSTEEMAFAVSPNGDVAHPVYRTMHTATGVFAVCVTVNVPDSLPVAIVENTEHDRSVRTFALDSLATHPDGVFHASGFELTAHSNSGSPALIPEG